MTREDVKSAKIANCYRHTGFLKDVMIESDFDVLHDIQLSPNMSEMYWYLEINSYYYINITVVPRAPFGCSQGGALGLSRLLYY